MNKTTEALRIEIEDLKNSQYELKEKLERESKRTDRVVQVLLNTLPKEELDREISFFGSDCQGVHRKWDKYLGFTLKHFLTYVVDP